MKKHIFLLLTAIISVSLFGTTIFANNKKATVIKESASEALSMLAEEMQRSISNIKY